MSASQTPAPQPAVPQTPALTASVMSPMSQQQEDSIIHTRITNDEKALRKVTRKFYHYTSVAFNSGVLVAPESSTSVDDARDAFLLDLASFNMSLKKSLMVCEAEARQIEEYQRERGRIESEHASLTDQIEGLKVSLEQAHLQRRRKIEYDVIAEKINAFPSREELEQSITAIENDILAIQAEHENQNNVFQAQQTAMEIVISSIKDLRRLGKEDIDVTEVSHAGSPAPDSQTGDDDVDMEPRARAETGEIPDDKVEEQETKSIVRGASLSKILNPTAKAFIPQLSSPSTPLLHSSAGTPLPLSESQPTTELEEGEDDDIEMGELAEEPVEKTRKAREEELEEGEASDLSSELSEPPDD
ncbi:Tho complex subunit 7-domain-containing protein [Irpex rosettiformis]|uniref:Tho complex subunit 7-domain-containing protein n=1 Tax=Irpex rosettiformis TaxID=378272 RepID=A0ACB8UC38_9APHY|nr:Tho complex subunit 7-domain-containing protein [Irpex rosettiformis]